MPSVRKPCCTVAPNGPVRLDFTGHPHLVHIYLPGEFEGHPLRKDFPLLSREVKPWPGLVDVEDMPDEGGDGAGGGPPAAGGGETGG